MYADLFHLRARAGSFSNELNWNAAYNIDPVLWWQSLFSSSYPELTALAKWALCIAPTTGAAERNWSAFGHIYSKKRNRLLNERVNKLVYIYWNLQIKERIGDQKNYWFDEDEDKNDKENEDQAGGEYAPDIYRIGVIEGNNKGAGEVDDEVYEI